MNATLNVKGVELDVKYKFNLGRDGSHTEPMGTEDYPEPDDVEVLLATGDVLHAIAENITEEDIIQAIYEHEGN